MIPLSLAEIAAVVGGSVDGDPTTQITGEVFVDSRRVIANGLFVAIAGDRADGHDFAASAHEAGAAAVLGSRATGVPMVIVEDPVRALGRLARHVRDRLEGLAVLAITGSQGKTGTKDYLAAVLATTGPTVATAGNFNNEIGVPLTVLRADPATAYLVVEMGARHVGNIAYLCEIARPDVATVLNVGTAHLGEFGSVDAIAATKGEIIETLAPGGTAVLAADDPRVAAMADRTAASVRTFGAEAPAGAGAASEPDVRWRNSVTDDLGRSSFELGLGNGWARVELAQLGGHQLVNAAAAAAMAGAVGVPLDQIAAALTAARPSSRWRMEARERSDGVLIINDAYNANPASMESALSTLGQIGRRGRRTIAVLGEMRELGDGADQAHADIGRCVAEQEIDVLVAVGTAAQLYARPLTAGWVGASGGAGEIVVTPGRDQALAWVRDNVAAGDVVLVKASRGVALEHVAQGLLDSAPDPETEPGETTR